VSQGQDFRDADHEPAVEDDAQRGRAGGDDRLLDLAERHQQQPGAQLIARQDPRQLRHLVDGGAVLQGKGVEVDGEDGASPLHQAPGRYRRVDPAREQGRHASGAADRKAARSGLALEGVEDAVVEHLDVDGELGVLETDGDARGHVNGRAQLALDLGRGEGESLERPPCPHAERGGTTGRHRRRGFALEGGEVGRHFVRSREVRHPEQIAQAPLGFRPGHVVGEIDAQAAVQHVNTATQVGQEPAGVPGQPVHEDGTVAALERDLVVAEDDVHLGQ